MFKGRVFLPVLAAVILLSAGLALLRIGQPASQDEIYDYASSVSIFNGEGRRTFQNFASALGRHTPLYNMVHAGAFNLFGESEIVAGGAGILMSLASVCAVFFSVLILGPGDRASNGKAALTAAALFAFLPSTIQGGLNLQPDGSLLVLLVLLLAFSFARFYREGSAARGALFAVLLGLAFWCRLAAPLLSAAVLLLLMLPAGRGEASKFGVWVLAGTGLFLATWYLYCCVSGAWFSGPFRYLIGAFAGKTPGTAAVLLAQPAKALTYLFLWTGAAASAMFIAHAIGAVRDWAGAKAAPGPDLAYLVLGAALVLGYSVIGGDAFGFPKYQAPGLALLCVFSGLRLAKAGVFPGKRHVLTIIAASAVLAAAIWGDPIYVLRYRLRELLAAGSAVLPEASLLAARTLLFCGAVYWLLRKFSRIYSLAVYSVLPAAAIGAALGISAMQSFAGYQTNYSYGAENTGEAARYVRSTIPAGARVLATADITRLLGYPPESYISDLVWNDRGLLLRTINSADTAAVVYGVASNTVRQVRDLEASGEIKSELERNFQKRRIGTSAVWIRVGKR